MQFINVPVALAILLSGCASTTSPSIKIETKQVDDESITDTSSTLSNEIIMQE